MIAAEQTGRKAFLMELDPPYCDVIVERWENFTGKQAERQTKEAGLLPPLEDSKKRAASLACKGKGK